MARRAERGFSLIEAVLALGVLAGVLISISGLFVLAEREVAAGRSASRALSVARSILEETGSYALEQHWRLFGFDGSSTSCTADTRTNPFAARWRAALDPALANGAASLWVESIGPEGGPPPLRETRAIRVTVIVSWDEGARRRAVTLRTVRP